MTRKNHSIYLKVRTSAAVTASFGMSWKGTQMSQVNFKISLKLMSMLLQQTQTAPYYDQYPLIVWQIRNFLRTLCAMNVCYLQISTPQTLHKKRLERNLSPVSENNEITGILGNIYITTQLTKRKRILIIIDHDFCKTEVDHKGSCSPKCSINIFFSTYSFLVPRPVVGSECTSKHTLSKRYDEVH